VAKAAKGYIATEELIKGATLIAFSVEKIPAKSSFPEIIKEKATRYFQKISLMESAFLLKIRKH